MQSILEEFAYGNVSPEVRFFKRNSRYGEAMGALATNEEKLLGKLNGDEREYFKNSWTHRARLMSLLLWKT